MAWDRKPDENGIPTLPSLECWVSGTAQHERLENLSRKVPASIPTWLARARKNADTLRELEDLLWQKYERELLEIAREQLKGG